MAKCIMLDHCKFINEKLADKPGIRETYKKLYCLGQPLECARLCLARDMAINNIPHNLLPGQSHKLEDISEI